jgi:hypothetical protein
VAAGEHHVDDRTLCELPPAPRHPVLAALPRPSPLNHPQEVSAKRSSRSLAGTSLGKSSSGPKPPGVCLLCLWARTGFSQTGLQSGKRKMAPPDTHEGRGGEREGGDGENRRQAKATPSKGLSAHIPGMAEAMESVSDKLKAAGEGAIFKRHSGAADVIVVSYCSTGEERWEMSNFHVHVGRDSKLGQSLQGVVAEVFVNESKTPLTMTVDGSYRCTFEGGQLRPSPAQALALGRVLVPGRNAVRYQLSGNRALFDIHACIFLWEHTDKVVVCDIDGTVTRSDFLGYSAHLMGYEYTHDGVTDVLNYLHEAGYRILFLTARPITVADRTRDLLQTVGATARDDKSQSFARLLGLHTSDTVLALPPGALITTSERWIPAIALSLSSDGPQKFKTTVLHEIKDLFGNSGVFAGGFGNRSTDSGAYRATGISASRIFLVDDSSKVFVGKMEGESQYPSYAALCERLPQLFPALRAATRQPTGSNRQSPPPQPGSDASSRAARAVSISRIEAAFEQFGAEQDQDLPVASKSSHQGSRRPGGTAGRGALGGGGPTAYDKTEQAGDGSPRGGASADRSVPAAVRPEIGHREDTGLSKNGGGRSGTASVAADGTAVANRGARVQHADTEAGEAGHATSEEEEDWM